MTEQRPGEAPNQFEKDKPGTQARDESEAAIEALRRQGGIFVEAVRVTRMPMAVTDARLPGNPIVFANQSFLDLCGYAMDEVLGQQPHFLAGPDTDSEDERLFRDAIERGEDILVESWQYRKDGGRFCAAVFVSPLRDDAGAVTHHFLSYLDITRRVVAEGEVRQNSERQMRQNEERFRVVVENAQDYAIFTTDAQDRITDWFAGAQSIFGWTAEEAIGQPSAITYVEEDRERHVPEQEAEAAAREGAAPNVRWHLRKDGTRVFIEGTRTALYHPDGSVRAFVKIGQDVTERKRREEHQRILLAELQHRVRNTLAVLRSIARRTAATSETVEEMAAHLQGRIDAFARVQSIVTRNPDAGLDLASLIEDELLAHAAREGERLRIEGPEISLKPRAAETISLAIHELVTNAVKYGALVADAGRLSIVWHRRQAAGGERLDLIWEENGLRDLSPEPARLGFGFELLQRTLPYELQAETEIVFRPEGLRFTLSMPLGADVLGQ